MEFKVNSKVLEKLLSKIIPAVPARTPMPILENFLFELSGGLLIVHATDLEISLKSSINVTANEDISIVIPARLIYDVVRSMDDVQVNFSVGGNTKLALTTEMVFIILTTLHLKIFRKPPRCQKVRNF